MHFYSINFHCAHRILCIILTVFRILNSSLVIFINNFVVYTCSFYFFLNGIRFCSCFRSLSLKIPWRLARTNFDLINIIWIQASLFFRTTVSIVLVQFFNSHSNNPTQTYKREKREVFSLSLTFFCCITPLCFIKTGMKEEKKNYNCKRIVK